MRMINADKVEIWTFEWFYQDLINGDKRCSVQSQKNFEYSIFPEKKIMRSEDIIKPNTQTSFVLWTFSRWVNNQLTFKSVSPWWEIKDTVPTYATATVLAQIQPSK